MMNNDLCAGIIGETHILVNQIFVKRRMYIDDANLAFDPLDKFESNVYVL